MEQEDYGRGRIARGTIKHSDAIRFDPVDGCRGHPGCLWPCFTHETSSQSESLPQRSSRSNSSLSRRQISITSVA